MCMRMRFFHSTSQKCKLQSHESFKISYLDDLLIIIISQDSFQVYCGVVHATRLLALLSPSLDFHLCGGIEEREMVSAIPLGCPGLSANAIPFFLGLSYWSLTGRSGIADLILYIFN